MVGRPQSPTREKLKRQHLGRTLPRKIKPTYIHRDIMRRAPYMIDLSRSVDALRHRQGREGGLHVTVERLLGSLADGLCRHVAQRRV